MPRPGPGERIPGSGRQVGTANRVTRDLKAMIEGALESVGGQRYLQRQALNNPSGFMVLLSKVLPRDLHISGTISIEAILTDLALELKQAKTQTIDVTPETHTIAHKQGAMGEAMGPAPAAVPAASAAPAPAPMASAPAPMAKGRKSGGIGNGA